MEILNHGRQRLKSSGLIIPSYNCEQNVKTSLLERPVSFYYCRLICFINNTNNRNGRILRGGVSTKSKCSTVDAGLQIQKNRKHSLCCQEVHAASKVLHPT